MNVADEQEEMAFYSYFLAAVIASICVSLSIEVGSQPEEEPDIIGSQAEGRKGFPRRRDMTRMKVVCSFRNGVQVQEERDQFKFWNLSLMDQEVHDVR